MGVRVASHSAAANKRRRLSPEGDHVGDAAMLAQDGALQDSDEGAEDARYEQPLRRADRRALAVAEQYDSAHNAALSAQLSTILTKLTPPSESSLLALVNDLRMHLTAMPKADATSLIDMQKNRSQVPSLQKLDPKWANMALAFEPPSNGNTLVVGSWAWGGALTSRTEGYCIDIAISIPPTLLQPKDYLHPRFAVKSLHYLLSISTSLPPALGPVTHRLAPLPGSQGWSLVISPSPNSTTGLGAFPSCHLRLRALWPADHFPSSKLSPARGLPHSHAATGSGPAPVDTTALYLSSAALVAAHLAFFESLARDTPAFATAVRLLGHWAARNGHSAPVLAEREFWPCVLAKTLEDGPRTAVPVGDSGAWTLFQQAIDWLAVRDWTTVVRFKMASLLAETYDEAEFREAFVGEPVFVDPTSSVNLLAGVAGSALDAIRHDARRLLEVLMSDADEAHKIDACFTNEVRLAEKWDEVVSFRIPVYERAGWAADGLSQLVRGMNDTLKKALSNRVRAFHLAPVPTNDSSQSQPTRLQLGLVFNPTEAGRLVDHGPPAADEPACEAFRAFWGAKSELRRFKDGSIVESVVWDTTPHRPDLGAQRSRVVGDIVTYILSTRHAFNAAVMQTLAGSMEHLLVESAPVRRAMYVDDVVATNKAFAPLMTAYDALVKELKALPDMPLAITAVQPSSPALRYTAIFMPSPRRLKALRHAPASMQYVELHDIVLTLEGSARWPDDLEGVQKIKLAFLAKIAEGLRARRGVAQADVAVDWAAQATDDNCSLEVLTAAGFAFRARILHERLHTLLQRQSTDGASASQETSLDRFKARFITAPRHHAAISNLYHLFPAYSATTRILKRWFSAHMLSPHVCEEVVELLSASVFVDASSPYDRPASGESGLARVMARLATWKWRDEPLLVPLYGAADATSSNRQMAFDKGQIDAARSAFKRLRGRDQVVDHFAWVVCTEEDVGGVQWGRKVGKVVAARVRALARATLDELEAQLRRSQLLVERLFVTPLDDYDFLIHLDATAVSRRFQASNHDMRSIGSNRGPPAKQAAETADGETRVRLAFDTAGNLAGMIQDIYRSALLLFYAPDGGSVLGGIWNPSATMIRPFRVDFSLPCAPAEGASDDVGKRKTTLDKLAVLSEIEELGGGFVERIEVLK